MQNIPLILLFSICPLNHAPAFPLFCYTVNGILKESSFKNNHNMIKYIRDGAVMTIEVPISIPKTLIIIPAYNEEEAIADTLTRLLKLKQHFTGLSICVINDGSHDKTAQIVKEFPVHLVNLPYNLGIGSAVQTGYKYAYENGYDIAIQFDADGQHNPDDLYKIIKPIAEDECDMVLGSRFTEKQHIKVVFPEESVFLFYCPIESTNKTNIYGSNFWISCYQSRSNYNFAHNYPKIIQNQKFLFI